jgi:cytochrome c6
MLAIAFHPPALAADAPDGAKIFNVQCAGCHVNGGNIVRRGKNMKQKALKKYGMNSLEAIANIVTNGKGNMSLASLKFKIQNSKFKIQNSRPHG